MWMENTFFGTHSAQIDESQKFYIYSYLFGTQHSISMVFYDISFIFPSVGI